MTPTAATTTDYDLVTHGAGLADRSEQGKLAFSGADAAEFLNGQVTNDVEALTPGTGCYGALLTPKGKMLADLRLLRTDDEFLLDTERATLQTLFNTLRRAMIGFNVELHKRTLERGLISLAGPQAAALAGAPELGAAPEHTHARVTVGGVNARVIRTDIGVDLLCDAADTERLRRVLSEAGAGEISEAVLETLRVEHGRPRYGPDLDDTVIPQEAGLNERAVSFTKGCYVGQETVARLHWRGKPNRHLRGIKLAQPVPSGTPLRQGEREVGRLGSVVVSPRLGAIGLALVRREVGPGSTVDAGGVAAEVVALPFS
jgi:folate-binding protein YgfZ